MVKPIEMPRVTPFQNQMARSALDAPPLAPPTVADLSALEEANALEAEQEAARVAQEAADDEQRRKGRRRADALLAGLRAIEDSGRHVMMVDGDDANCIWAAASLFNRMAGRPDPGSSPAPVSDAATASVPAKRVLSPEVERAAATPLPTVPRDADLEHPETEVGRETVVHDFTEPRAEPLP